MWSLDRRVAASAIVGAALALAVPIAMAHGPAPEKSGHDRIALAQEIVALANRGAQAPWLVTYAFTRTNTNGNQLHNTLVIAHTPAIEVDDGLGSLLVTANGHSYSCTVVGNQPSCLTTAAVTGTSRPGAVYGGAIVSGRYDITRGPTATIAGLAARCFELSRQRDDPIAGLGYTSEQCYSADGVPLRSRITRPGGTDEQVALTVRRTVGRDDLLPLLGQYGLERLAPAE